MESTRRAGIFAIVRNFLFSIVNKEFLIFLFFLFVSGAFWLAMALNEDCEYELIVPVRMEGVPQKVVVTSDIADTLRVTVRDKGYLLLPYFFNDVNRTAVIQFKNYDKGNGRGAVSSAELQKLVRPMLFKSNVITQVKPDRMDFTYNYGESKRVPVRLKGNVQPGESHYVARIAFTPETVTIYASKEKLDSIRSVYTEDVALTNLVDTVERKVALRAIRGVKFEPAEVRVSFYPDVLTEESIEVPITAVNMPEGKILRTFPSKVKVLFTTGASTFRNIHAEHFSLVVDYYEIMAQPSDKCAVKLAAVPHGVRNARPEVTEVNYLIEEQ